MTKPCKPGCTKHYTHTRPEPKTKPPTRLPQPEPETIHVTFTHSETVYRRMWDFEAGCWRDAPPYDGPRDKSPFVKLEEHDDDETI